MTRKRTHPCPWNEYGSVSLLRDNMSDEAFYNLVNAEQSRQERFDRAIGWARFVHELEPLAAKLEEKHEAGRTAVIRDSARLNESIEMLSGSTRQRLLAKNRLNDPFKAHNLVTLLIEYCSSACIDCETSIFLKR